VERSQSNTGRITSLICICERSGILWIIRCSWQASKKQCPDHRCHVTEKEVCPLPLNYYHQVNPRAIHQVTEHCQLLSHVLGTPSLVLRIWLVKPLVWPLFLSFSAFSWTVHPRSIALLLLSCFFSVVIQYWRTRSSNIKKQRITQHRPFRGLNQITGSQLLQLLLLLLLECSYFHATPYVTACSTIGTGAGWDDGEMT
jgi:hypothetical protein